MSRLTDLLGRAKSKTDVPSYATEDKAMLRRRISSILARPTRKELNPPDLAPQDTALDGIAEQPPLAPLNDETAWQEEIRNVSGDQVDTRSGPQADEVTVPGDVGIADTGIANTGVADVGPRDEPDAMPPTAPDGADFEMDGNGDTLESLRDRLRERLEALRHESGEEEVPASRDNGDPAPTGNIADGSTDDASPPIPAALSDVLPAPADENTPSGTDSEMEAAGSLHAGNGAPSWSRDTIDLPPLAPDSQGLLVSHEATAMQTAETEANAVALPLHDEEESDDGALPSGPEQDTRVAPIKSILLPASLADQNDGERAAELAVKVADYLMFDAGYYPEELPRAAVMLWCMDFLVRNVAENGLGAFVYNAWGQPELWAACSEGLNACGAIRHLEAFEALSELLVHDGGLAVELSGDPAAGSDDQNFARIEQEFMEAENAAPLAKQAGDWLLTQDNMEFVDDALFQESVSALGDAPGLESRRHEAT